MRRSRKQEISNNLFTLILVCSWTKACSLGLPTLNYTEVYGLTATRMKSVKHYVSNPYYALLSMVGGYTEDRTNHRTVKIGGCMGSCAWMGTCLGQLRRYFQFTSFHRHSSDKSSTSDAQQFKGIELKQQSLTWTTLATKEKRCQWIASIRDASSVQYVAYCCGWIE